MRGLLFLISMAFLASVVFIVFMHRRKQKRNSQVGHKEPHLGEQDTLPVGVDEEIIEPEAKAIEAVDQASSVAENIIEKPSEDRSDGVIVMGVLAKNGMAFAGYELLQALLANGFRYGKMHIFHRHEESSGRGPVLFSLASATEPGTFEISKMGSHRCYGLSIFMRFSGQRDLLQSLELMIASAKQLAEDLGGELVDERRQALTQDKITSLKDRVKSFEQGKLTADLFD